MGIKAALKTDAVQAKQGGFAGPYEKAKQQKAGAKIILVVLMVLAFGVRHDGRTFT